MVVSHGYAHVRKAANTSKARSSPHPEEGHQSVVIEKVARRQMGPCEERQVRRLYRPLAFGVLWHKRLCASSSIDRLCGRLGTGGSNLEVMFRPEDGALGMTSRLSRAFVFTLPDVSAT